MKIKLSEGRYMTVTKLQVQRTLFGLLSVVMALVVARQAMPGGRATIAKLDNELQRVYFDERSVLVYVGDALEAQPNCQPPDAKVSYVWELEDDGVLQVEDGKIVAAKNGRTTVRVTAGQHSATLRVTAQYRQLPPDSTLPPLYYEELPIANYNHTLSADDVPADLIQIPAAYVAANYYTLYVSQETFNAYLKLLAAMQAELGSSRMHIISAYRSYARQAELYNAAVRSYMAAGNTSERARVLALNTTQTPGNSEHQLGNSIDVSNDNTTDHNYLQTPEGAWLAENAHKYGFVIRYPADKEDITRIAYEPWHIRYVGIFHATYMYVNHVCLEEYVDLQAQAKEAAEAYSGNKE